MDETRYTHREHMLETARGYVTKDRNKAYGEPDEDFQRIADIASAMGFRKYATDTPDVDGQRNPSFRALTGHDVSLFMIALKLSRLAWSPDHEDSWTDIAGYAACGYETALLEAERSRGPQRSPAPPFTEAAAVIGRSNLEDMASVYKLDRDIKELAEKAIKGAPHDLEQQGWMVIDAAPGAGAAGECPEHCSSGHRFHSDCLYRIRRRRNG